MAIERPTGLFRGMLQFMDFKVTEVGILLVDLCILEKFTRDVGGLVEVLLVAMDFAICFWDLYLNLGDSGMTLKVKRLMWPRMLNKDVYCRYEGMLWLWGVYPFNPCGCVGATRQEQNNIVL